MQGSYLRNTLLAASLALLGPGEAGSQAAAAARTRSVTIENLRFNPATLAVHRGERIVWVNQDLFPHTVTATDKAFDSGSIAAGGSWSYVANQAGQFSYGCSFHPTMAGKLQVQ